MMIYSICFIYLMTEAKAIFLLICALFWTEMLSVLQIYFQKSNENFMENNVSLP